MIGFASEYNVNGKSFTGMSLYYCGIIGLSDYWIINMDH